jgi:hypothetical protein
MGRILSMQETKRVQVKTWIVVLHVSVMSFLSIKPEETINSVC